MSLWTTMDKDDKIFSSSYSKPIVDQDQSSCETVPPLNVILLHPTFWHPSKMIIFIKRVSDYLKGLRKPEKELYDELESNLQGDCSQMLGGDWTSKLTDEVWKYMKENRKRSRYKGNKVIHLIRFMRNLSDHYWELPSKIREELGELPHGFMSYFLDKFPTLLHTLFSFVFKFILEHESSFERFYPMKNCKQFIMIKYLEQSLQAMMNGITHHSKTGGLLKRYKVTRREGGSESTCEVTFLKVDVSSSIKFHEMTLIKIRDGFLQVVHSPKNFQDSTVLLKCPCSLMREVSMTIVFCVNDVIPVNTLETMILTPEIASDSIEKAMQVCFLNEEIEYHESPLTLSDLDETFPTDILNRKVMFQGCKITLNDIFTWVSNAGIIKTLKDEALNRQLLQDLIHDKVPVVLSRATVDPPSYYIERSLFPRKFVTLDNIKQSFDTTPCHLIVISLVNQGPGHNVAFFSEMVGSKYQIKLSSCLVNEDKLTFPLLILLEHDCHLDLIVRKIEDVSVSYTVLAFHHGNYFEWITSKGDVGLIRNHLENISIPEAELITKYHQAHQNHNGPILIADSPGMGKTTILHNITNNLIRECPTKIVKFYSLPEMSKQLRKREESTSNCNESSNMFIDNVVSILSAQDKGPTLYNRIVENLILSTAENTPTTTMEVMLDGLDECDLYQWSHARSIIRVIEKKLKNVRMWVTTRLHFSETLEHSMPIMGYCITPLDRKNQVDLLVRYWSQTMPLLEKKKFIEIEKLANCCLDSAPEDYMEIAEIPLQCQLLAEVHELKVKQVVESQVTFEKATEALKIYSVQDLYEKFIETKLMIYMKKDNVDMNQTTGHMIKQARKNMMLVHENKAIELLLPHWMQVFSCNYFLAHDNDDDVALAYGIMESKGGESFSFSHRTFGEYFIAHFVVTNLLNRSEPTANDFLNTICDFLINEILKLDETATSFVNGAVIIKFLILMLEKLINDETIPEPVSSSIYRTLAMRDNWNKHFTEILLALIKTRTIGTLHFLLQSLEQELNIREFIHGCDKKMLGDLICTAVKKNKLQVLKRICAFVEGGGISIRRLKYCKQKEGYDIWGRCEKMPYMPLHTALTKPFNYDIIEFLINEKGFSYARKTDLGGAGALHLCVEQLTKDCRIKNKGKLCLEEGLRVIRLLVSNNRDMLHEDVSYLFVCINRFMRGRFRRCKIKPFPLIYATVIGAPVEVIECLVDLGANVNSADAKNYTMLHISCPCYTPEEYHCIASLVFDHRFDPTRLTNDKNTILHLAVQKYHNLLPETITLFKTKDVDFNAVNENGESALELAIKHGALPTVLESLIQACCRTCAKQKSRLQ